MSTFKSSGLLSLSALLLAGNPASAQNKSQKPNIIFILADDLGYTDVNCFATRATNTPAGKQFYETPNLNKLAEQGVSFSQAYACPLCAPTRSSILTGKYASRLGFMTATAGNASTYYAGTKSPLPKH